MLSPRPPLILQLIASPERDGGRLTTQQALERGLLVEISADAVVDRRASYEHGVRGEMNETRAGALLQG
jgi:hypothetical protein